ncbi:ATP synthase subunit I [Natribacillus halophilus]|uniref:ATP synthase I chain n=1 Tax=Natribacillus halophilus TaxID=549003 RepID=A0A1G8KUF0_9BACI|nr:ATP synthase subunit I [Natribacillus halophilus]SDI47041.1 ATP synthase I chain [Natribacillus halophilus]
MPLLRHRMKLYCWVVAVVVFINICALFLTPYHSVMFGFLLGMASCFLGFTSIYMKALVIEKAAVRKTPGMLSYLMTAFGVVLRYGLIAVAVAIALIFPETFHLGAVLAGYAGLYLYITVDMFVQLQKER